MKLGFDAVGGESVSLPSSCCSGCCAASCLRTETARLHFHTEHALFVFYFVWKRFAFEVMIVGLF